MAQKSNEITPQDELKLRWYFSLGISAFEFSTFGKQIELAQLLNQGSVTCKNCHGDGISGAGAYAVLCRSCGGKGSRPSAINDDGPSRFGTGACPKCHGICGNEECAQCGGDGYIEECGAFETGDQPRALHEPDVAQMKLYGEVARMLRALNTSHNRVLGRFYGDTGERWARTDRGRLFSLYDLTKAGKSLLATFAKPTEACLPPLERIGVAAELERTKSVDQRRMLLASALTQATRLFEATSVAWVGARSGAKGVAA
jgi:hypothetical protein